MYLSGAHGKSHSTSPIPIFKETLASLQMATEEALEVKVNPSDMHIAAPLQHNYTFGKAGRLPSESLA